ncbi:hypothetical protein TWF730_001809 [Orbilia blumenaviensis]|uniref:Uncharacterized protein n=1 Tax=Orbilia blumenaviensis TaxID=1796055 RepID=A0AAV9UED7_9PEZI
MLLPYSFHLWIWTILFNNYTTFTTQVSGVLNDIDGMWVAHFAPSLLLTRFAPSTPLWALAFAGALPDFLFFALNIAGLESGHDHSAPPTVTFFGQTLKGSSTDCLPYPSSYPYTHSTIGQLSIALLFAVTITLAYRLPLTSLATLLLATLSHLPLDIAISRDESAIVGGEYTKPIWKRDASVPLLDYPWGTFTSDLGIFVFAILFHARTVYPPEEYEQKRGQPNITSTLSTDSGLGRTESKKKMNLTYGYLGIIVFAAIIQAHFSFFAEPAEEWSSAVVFMLEILGFVGALHWLEGYTRVVDNKVSDLKKKN